MNNILLNIYIYIYIDGDRYQNWFNACFVWEEDTQTGSNIAPRWRWPRRWCWPMSKPCLSLESASRWDLNNKHSSPDSECFSENLSSQQTKHRILWSPSQSGLNIQSKQGKQNKQEVNPGCSLEQLWRESWRGGKSFPPSHPLPAYLLLRIVGKYTSVKQSKFQ